MEVYGLHHSHEEDAAVLYGREELSLLRILRRAVVRITIEAPAEPVVASRSGIVAVPITGSVV